MEGVSVTKRVIRPPAASEEERRERIRIQQREWRHRNPEKMREFERRKRQNPRVMTRRREEAYRSYMRKREARIAAGWVPDPRGRRRSVVLPETYSAAYRDPSAERARQELLAAAEAVAESNRLQQELEQEAGTLCKWLLQRSSRISDD